MSSLYELRCSGCGVEEPVWLTDEELFEEDLPAGWTVENRAGDGYPICVRCRFEAIVGQMTIVDPEASA